ncbi:unnamed protein product [Thelazia callipaeda]|uniref:WW domain-binding protein 4 n=1 Tax=Thelazia callipaeda TaxID=103827 RepID=A0A0N5DAH1_THECL|nr:unnamed protein product [Thelazia callipaeda]
MVLLTPEEELEKQYRDYKAQFEQWKEKNKNSVGTEAYVAYVKQFEAWERDVDQRREMIRAKAENDAQEAQATALAKAKAVAEAKLKKEQEMEEERKKKLEAETAAQAAAYAKHQQSYLTHHQSAMQLEQQLHQAALSGSKDSLSVHTADSKSVDGDYSYYKALDPTHVAKMMKHMAQVAQLVMGDQGDGTYQQTIQTTVGQTVPPPQLWGNDRITYDLNDLMYKRWAMRAAPPYYKPTYKPPPSDYQVTPCWLYVEQMKEEKLMLAPQVNMPPPPFIPKFVSH